MGPGLMSFYGLWKSAYTHTNSNINQSSINTFAFEKLKNCCSIRYQKPKVFLTIVVKCHFKSSPFENYFLTFRNIPSLQDFDSNLGKKYFQITEIPDIELFRARILFCYILENILQILFTLEISCELVLLS